MAECSPGSRTRFDLDGVLTHDLRVRSCERVKNASYHGPSVPHVAYSIKGVLGFVHLLILGDMVGYESQEELMKASHNRALPPLVSGRGRGSERECTFGKCGGCRCLCEFLCVKSCSSFPDSFPSKFPQERGSEMHVFASYGGSRVAPGFKGFGFWLLGVCNCVCVCFGWTLGGGARQGTLISTDALSLQSRRGERLWGECAQVRR